ncbi:MAG TPA: citrate synthase [Acidimicrobiales bacterium]
MTRTATDRTSVLAAPGLEGVVVAETSIGDVRGLEGFYHYRQYSAVELAAKRSFADVVELAFRGELPTKLGMAAAVIPRSLPAGLAAILPQIAATGTPLDVLRSAVSLLGAELSWRPILDTPSAELLSQALELCSLVPTVLSAVDRLRRDLTPIEPRDDLGFSENYLWMLHGEEPEKEVARAVEQYLILVIDHGFNASTFTARVIASTGADLAACICGAIGAMSGPLHGGAPSRALDMLDEIGDPSRTAAFVRGLVGKGDRVMGFGHRVYKTDDPRSRFLRELADRLHAPLLDFATDVEQFVEATLAELKPGRELHANVEFYAGVVMDACGISRDMFTPTFATGRVVGWCAHVMEQAAHNRLIRPSARYVGPSAPQPVPTS